MPFRRPQGASLFDETKERAFAREPSLSVNCRICRGETFFHEFFSFPSTRNDGLINELATVPPYSVLPPIPLSLPKVMNMPVKDGSWDGDYIFRAYVKGVCVNCMRRVDKSGGARYDSLEKAGIRQRDK